ncbi:coiled-coil domain-containing glutamate-rich protein 2 isoform X2 [Hyla sarda]|uniref:coiled-coil domain-containing glutamate-rich protein 2 isoform X2 n=2 Tax=Hyla sarda TaxID=327740 RepID=UPI0024C46F46|nr:coiled-coil domain-containing glutamate-rich protein 2 isoform X2 [Hyla sarda]
MGPVTCLLLAAVCMQVSAMPLSSQLSEEEEKVTRCIMEVLAESLSSPGPERVSSSCIRILKEEKSQLHAERDSIEEEELKKRANETPKRDPESKRESEHEGSKEYEKIEKVQVKEKEHGTSDEEKVHEMLEEEEEKRNAPVKKGDDDKRNGKEARSDGAAKRKDKKHFSEESDEDSSEEREHERGHQGANDEWYHRNHDGWEEKKRASHIRMAEDPSLEETAQFESEDRGMKYFNTKTHMNGYHGEDKRHVHHPEENEMDRERTYYGQGEDEMERERHHHNGRPGNHEHREEEEEEERELEEMEEREEHRAKERDIHEVEEELRKAAERLQELHRG